MASLYQQDLAYIQASAFGALARGAAPEIVGRLKSAAISIRHVVDMGCGAGPLAAALIGAGFEVTGFDTSPELLRLARAAAPDANFVNVSLYDTEIPACQAVVALGEPLTYYAEDRDPETLFPGLVQRIAAALPTGGLFIFDVIEMGEPSLSGRFWSSGEDYAVLVETTEDTADRTLVRNIETFRQVGELYRRGREIHRVRLFDTQRVCDRLNEAGFRIDTSQAYGAQRLAPRRRAFFATRV